MAKPKENTGKKEAGKNISIGQRGTGMTRWGLKSVIVVIQGEKQPTPSKKENTGNKRISLVKTTDTHTVM